MPVVVGAGCGKRIKVPSGFEPVGAKCPLCGADMVRPESPLISTTRSAGAKAAGCVMTGEVILWILFIAWVMLKTADIGAGWHSREEQMHDALLAVPSLLGGFMVVYAISRIIGIGRGGDG